jgi:hypothetical protein
LNETLHHDEVNINTQRSSNFGGMGGLGINNEPHSHNNQGHVISFGIKVFSNSKSKKESQLEIQSGLVDTSTLKKNAQRRTGIATSTSVNRKKGGAAATQSMTV